MTIENLSPGIGMAMLRDQALPNPFGQIFVDKVITDVYNILHQKESDGNKKM